MRIREVFSDEDIERINKHGPNADDYEKVAKILKGKGIDVDDGSIAAIFKVSKNKIEALIDGWVNIKDVENSDKAITKEEQINRMLKILHVNAIESLDLISPLEAKFIIGKIKRIKSNDSLEVLDTLVCFLIKEMRELRKRIKLLYLGNRLAKKRRRWIL